MANSLSWYVVSCDDNRRPQETDIDSETELQSAIDEMSLRDEGRNASTGNSDSGGDEESRSISETCATPDHFVQKQNSMRVLHAMAIGLMESDNSTDLLIDSVSFKDELKASEDDILHPGEEQ